MVSIAIARDVAGLFVGSILYGLYLPTLFFCLQCLIWDAKKSQNSVHWVTLLSALMLWACSTLNLLGGVARSVQTITHCDNEFGAVIGWTNIVKVVLIVSFYHRLLSLYAVSHHSCFNHGWRQHSSPCLRL